MLTRIIDKLLELFAKLRWLAAVSDSLPYAHPRTASPVRCTGRFVRPSGVRVLPASPDHQGSSPRISDPVSRCENCMQSWRAATACRATAQHRVAEGGDGRQG